jgi:GNAT superfamily N-acetyltransferase
LPGDFIGALPVNSVIHPAGLPIAHLPARVLRGPVEFTLHISMVFVRPDAQRTGVGLPLFLHILEVARSLGYGRADVWTARENRPARGLYERAGMALTGKTAPLRSSTQLQYGSFLNGAEAPRPNDSIIRPGRTDADA